MLDMVTALSILFGAIAFCLTIGVPIGISIGTATALTMFFTTKFPLIIISQNAFTALDSFPLLAIPLFILSGNLMSYGGISRRLVALADALVGFICGGLAIVTVVACMFFSAISGSSVATVSAIGSFMIPEMAKKKYDAGFAAALAASAGSLGVIIPPSISFVVYGVMTGVSIGELFTAGIVPGILLGLGMIVLSYWVAKKRNYPKGEKMPWNRVFAIFKDAIWAVMVPVIILGGIYGGVFTPTEAAAVAGVYSLVVGKFIYKELTRETLRSAFRDAVLVNGAVTFMIGLSMAFARYLTMAGIPRLITEMLLQITDSGWITLLIINIILLITGCFIDNISGAIILTPILLPIVQSFGVDAVHFGVIITVGLAIGFITPPYGPNLFVASAISGVSLEPIVRNIWMFCLVLTVIFFFITYIPGISLWLVHLIYG
jgi:C4-dicarboxylate transporter DctM subunit